MLCAVLLTTAVVGQTAADGRVLSVATKPSHARALAELRANQHTIQPRLEANYRLESKRLSGETTVVNVATDRVPIFAGGTRYGQAPVGERGSFASVAPSAVAGTDATGVGKSSLAELKEENFPPAYRLSDARFLYCQAGRIYAGESPVRRQLAACGAR